MNKLKIITDPRMELLTALQLIAEDPNIYRKPSSYLSDMQEWFSPFSQHPAVLHYKSINESFCFDAPVNSMLWMKYDNELELISEPMDYFYLRAGSKDNWIRFFEGLREFAKDTNFTEFYHVQQGYYSKAISNVKATIANCDPVKELEQYIRMYSEQYTFIYSPLQTCGYGGCGAPEDIGVVCTIGFDCETHHDREEICLRCYLWHEFGHYYINPILDEYLAQNPEIDQALDDFIKTLHIDEDRFTFVNHYECFVRAITYKLNEIYYGKQEADGILQWEESDGFLYIRHFIKALGQFEIARDKRKASLRDYFPILIRDVIS